MYYQLNKKDKTFNGEIILPSSKSISNRIQIINALAYSPYNIQNLSDCDDTRIMHEVLSSNTNYFDIGHAGTAMRFLTAFLSKIVGEWTITGSSRMKERPIQVLVNALVELGAKIEYIEKEGYPPLRIWGSSLKGKTLELDGSISSQFISALLMIAPVIQNGLTIRLKNKVISASYIRLTLKLMEQFGIRYSWKDNQISIGEQAYTPHEYTVESDWSGASYWYMLATLSSSSNIKLKGLFYPSIQGDSILYEWFIRFGIDSIQESDGIRLIKKSNIQPNKLILDFTENPDIAQTMAVLCVLKELPFHFSGLETLKIKETDRIAALKNELSKLGAYLEEPHTGELRWDGKKNTIISSPKIDTYNDHRMALSFAPAALFFQNLQINNPEVVSKSYPHYWNDLQKVGFNIESKDK